MNRTKFFNITSVNGINEVDHLHNNLSLFEQNHQVRYYRINSHDIAQPDLISKKMYNTERYWWIICLVNGIIDPFNDIVVGEILQIPDILDIYDFYQKFSVR